MITPDVPRKQQSVTKIVAGVGVLVVLAGLLSVVNQGSFAPPTQMRTQTAVSDQSLATTLAKNFAPVIYLFKDDRNRPSSVEYFFGISKLMNADGTVKLSSPNSASVGAASSDCYFEMNNPPTKQNPIETGDATSNGASSAPLYARVFDDGTHYRITYGLFYPVSGFQIFRISYKQNGKTKKRNFEWAEMAFHQGDWEHVQVWVTKTSPYTFVGLAPGQHGSEYYYAASSVTTEGGHPVLYSAWNTHAMYPTTSQNAEYTFPTGWITLGSVNWLKIIDTTQTDQTTKDYASASDRNDAPIKLNGEANVVVTNGKENSAGMEWLNFDGRWGPPVSNSMENPPSFGPSNVERFLRDLKGAVNSLGKALWPDLFTAKGPKAPETQGWWQDKIPNDAPSGQI